VPEKANKKDINQNIRLKGQKARSNLLKKNNSDNIEQLPEILKSKTTAIFDDTGCPTM